MVQQVLHVYLQEVASFTGIALELISNNRNELAHNLKQQIANLPVNISISFLCLKNEHFKLVFSVSHIDYAHVLVSLTHVLVLVQALIGIEDLLSFKTHNV
jgi:hypothetical protein